jgi:hypothetical protein
LSFASIFLFLIFLPNFFAQVCFWTFCQTFDRNFVLELLSNFIRFCHFCQTFDRNFVLELLSNFIRFCHFLSNFWQKFCFRTFVKLYSILSFFVKLLTEIFFSYFFYPSLIDFAKKCQTFASNFCQKFLFTKLFSRNYFAINIFTLFCLYIFLKKIIDVFGLGSTVEHESTCAGPRRLVGGSTASSDPCGRLQTWVAH